MHRRQALAFLASCAAASASVPWLAACSPQSGGFHGINLTGSDYAKDFALIDHHGQPRRLADFRGKVVVVFFGFVQCPDVCPTSLLTLAQAKQQLGADGERLQGLFITLDPERDTPEVLKAYMDSFDPGFLALYTRSPEELAALAKDFKVYYKRIDGPTPTSYTLEHTAASYVYDTQGRLRLYESHGVTPEALASDVRRLLQETPAA